MKNKLQSRKGMSPFISGTLIIIIGIFAAVMLIGFVKNMIDQGKAYNDFNKAKQDMSLIDSIVKELSFEAPGSMRTIKLEGDVGKFIVSGKEDKIKYRIETDTPLLDPGTVSKEGDLTIVSGNIAKAYEDNISGNEVLVLENDDVLFAVYKYGNKTDPVFINTTRLIALMKNKNLNINVTPVTKIMIDNKDNSSYGYGYTEIVEKGEYLPSGTIKLVMSQYEVLFTLKAGQDFVETEIKLLL